ncbi:MAG: hypothetical protein AAF436_17335 [Myxococcota bacterium]
MNLPSSALRSHVVCLASVVGIAAGVFGCDQDFLNVIDVSVSGAGSGTGLVTSTEEAVPINCRIVAGQAQGSCVLEIEEAGAGGVFSLEAEPEPGSVFTSWNGCNQVIGGRCQLSFDPGQDDVRFFVTATFDLDAEDPCNTAYGASPGYALCSQTESSCTFYTLLNDIDSCNSRCAAGGGSCLASIGDTDNTCVPGEPGSCNDVVGDRICECTKP